MKMKMMSARGAQCQQTSALSILAGEGLVASRLADLTCLRPTLLAVQHRCTSTSTEPGALLDGRQGGSLLWIIEEECVEEGHHLGMSGGRVAGLEDRPLLLDAAALSAHIERVAKGGQGAEKDAPGPQVDAGGLVAAEKCLRWEVVVGTRTTLSASERT